MDLAFPSQQTPRDPKMIGQWKVGRTIGRGCSGRVRIARHSKTGQYAAIKIIFKASLAASRVSLNRLADEVEREKLAVEREIVVMKLINHPNIMHLYDVWETSTHLYLVLEYIQGGELFDHICKHGPLPIIEALKYFHQIISAVDYFHRFNIAHRDLKPENILLDHNLNVKIADFGMAAWQINTSGTTDLMKTSCGSPHYAAPEIIRGEPYVGSSADIWSCGVILYALLTAQLPFDDDNLPDLLDKVTAGRFTIPSFVDPLAHNLIRRMLVVNVKRRITMSEIFEHPFTKLHTPHPPICVIPELSRIANPLKTKSCIDPDIFANLRTLWHDAPDEDLIKSLLNEDKNWQKGIYHLLVNYRANQAPEDDISESEVEKGRARKAKDIAEKAKKAAVVLLKRREAGELITPSCSDDRYPPRAEPPTPRKARGRYLISTTGTDVDTGSSKSEDLDYLMLDGRISRPPLAETSNKSRRPSVNRTLPKIPHLEVADLGEVGMSGPGISKLCTQAQVGDGNHGGFELDRPTVKKETRQLVFSLGQNPPYMTGYTVMAPTATRPLSVKRKPQKTARVHGSRIVGPANKENAIGSDESGNCVVDLSDAHNNLRRKRSLNRHHRLDPESDELGHCAHGKLIGSVGSKRSPQSQHSQPRSGKYPSPGSSGTPSPKHTWLDTIFRIKPSYSTKHTLYSTWDIITTRNECRRLLMNMDIQVQIFRESQESVTGRGEESSSATITMKCKMDEMEDSTGILGIMRSTKFRVEMKNVESLDLYAISVYNHQLGDSETEEDEDMGRVMVTLTHEKGSGESFREIVRRLKKEWTLESGGPVGVL